MTYWYKRPISLWLAFFIGSLPGLAYGAEATGNLSGKSSTSSLNLNQVTDEAATRLIEAAERHLLEGREDLKAGRLQSARTCFELAVITIQGADFNLRATPRMRNYLDKLLAQIREIEQASPSQTAQAAAGGQPAPLKESQALPDANLPKETDSEEKEKPSEPSLVEDAAKDAALFSLKIDPKLREMVSEDLAKARFAIPMVYNEKVAHYINYFQTGPRRDKFAAGLARSGKYLPMMQEYFAEAGIPEEVIYMALVESLFSPFAYSRARAKGIWQFMAATGKLYGLRQDAYIDERSDPERSTQAAVRHTLDLYRQFEDWILVMAAYNAGGGAVSRAIQRAGTRDFWKLAARGYLPRETVNHIPLIMAGILIVHDPEKYGFSSGLLPALELDKVEVGRPVSLRLVAKLTGLSVEEIRDLNPELRGACTPPNYPEYTLKLPLGMGEELTRQLEDIPASAWVEKSDLKRPPPDRRAAQTKGKGRRGTTGGSATAANGRSSGEKPQIAPAKSSSAVAQAAPGKRLVHKVKKGDNLAKIAARYNTNVESLRGWNKLSSLKIRPGDRLTVYLRH